VVGPNFFRNQILEEKAEATSKPNASPIRELEGDAQDVPSGGRVWNLIFNIQLSPLPTPSVIGKSMLPPLTALASLIGQLKREKARSYACRDLLPPVLCLVSTVAMVALPGIFI
jgi:hypothetical protein